ncbi:hypothetical protein Tco_0094091, partial [Tanacetum coccineum]
DKLATASALTLNQPGTPPTDVIETIADTIVSTIPHRPFEPYPTREDSSTAGTPKEPKAPTAKRSLNRDLSLEAKKKNIRMVMTVWKSSMAENNRQLKLFPAFSANQSYSNLV